MNNNLLVAITAEMDRQSASIRDALPTVRVPTLDLLILTNLAYVGAQAIAEVDEEKKQVTACVINRLLDHLSVLPQQRNSRDMAGAIFAAQGIAVIGDRYAHLLPPPVGGK